MSTIIFQIQSVFIVALMLRGIWLILGKERKIFKHMKTMKVVIVWDLLLILQIELNRGAINTAMKALENKWLLNVHILLALSTVITYGILFHAISKYLKAQGSGQITTQGASRNPFLKRHSIAGKICVSLRVMTLVTSFMIH